MSIFDTARFVISAAKLSGLPPEAVPEIAFAGRSNAGKSTTINVLTRKTRLAFASKTPGRTQLINFFALSKKNEAGVREDVGCLVDLPGYGFAKASEDTRRTWSDLVGGYIARREALTGLVIVMDARRPFMPTDEWLIEFMKEDALASQQGRSAEDHGTTQGVAGSRSPGARNRSSRHGAALLGPQERGDRGAR